MDFHWFSWAQAAGYVAFALGVGSFLQTDDRRFKLFMAAECATYVVHFHLLGVPTAVASSLVSVLRSVLALHTRSPWVAAGIVALNVGLGVALVEAPADALPLAASCLGTLALFLLQGVAMRLVMLCGTGLWIANNVIAGSVGGTALEVVVAAVNGVTIVRLLRRRPPGQAPGRRKQGLAPAFTGSPGASRPAGCRAAGNPPRTRQAAGPPAR